MNPQTSPQMQEDHISQVPAIQLLQNLGYAYLSPSEALAVRGGKVSGVILDGVLEAWLRQNNVIRFKGEEVPFSEGNVVGAIQALKEVLYDGLVRTNEKIYDLLCLGKSLQQSIQGDVKSFTLQYVDWEQPERNVFHVTEEFAVERSGSKETFRPDLVLFVNGIPLAVIECKRPDLGPGKDPIREAISQHLRNQKDDGIPQLFLFSQLLLAVSKNHAKYGTTGTPAKFWAVWKEREQADEVVREAVNRPLAVAEKTKLFADRFQGVRAYFDALEAEGDREVTEQDRAIFGLCRPERLLELAYRFVLYDAGVKKIARYQQYFCVRKITERIRRLGPDGTRSGGVVWHTQGSGKSLTMVMLAKAIALDPAIEDHKIVLVTDRIDLDDQLYRTFHSCGKEVEQARTGKDLLEMLVGHKQRIVTTVIDKFDAAVGRKDARNESADIFVLVDEGHRGQYGPRHAKMRKVLPNACYIGFTGTPVMKKDRDTVKRFGGLIDTYTIGQAVEDMAVVPLLYEGRHVMQRVDAVSIDGWFEKITAQLTKEQVADLKRKFATADQLNKAEQMVMRVAWDVSEHFRDNWQHTPFKAQLVTPGKATALLYKKYLDVFGMVSSEVLISGPDDREGETDIYEENQKEVARFWKPMMAKYGSERDYNRQIINAFRKAEEPEILVVVDKLLTGFDEPRNTVLYLARNLKEHTLLQAIARVNRLHDGKDFGFIIDYYGVLENLDHALDLYSSLPDFDEKDLEGTLTDVAKVIKTLPQKHSSLWDLFKAVKNKRDEEQYELLLADESVRVKFYERFTDYARALSIALSSALFLEKTPEAKIDTYQRDLKFFAGLRTAVRQRYAEVIDYSEYEPKIRKLIDTHVGTGEVEKITGLVNIFDQASFAKEVEALYGEAAKADTIAHRTIRTIEEKMAEDPAFYKKFSTMLKEAIDAFHENRIKANEYLKKVKEIMVSVVNRVGDKVPAVLQGRDVAKAFYGSVMEVLPESASGREKLEEIGAELAGGIEELVLKNRIVGWTDNPDIQNQIRTRIEDYLFEAKARLNLHLSFEQIDAIMEGCIEIARVRVP
jgi:type I restriction enzyme R subunit